MIGSLPHHAAEILDDFIPIKDPPLDGHVDRMETFISGCEKEMTHLAQLRLLFILDSFHLKEYIYFS
jgi:hypothetical protein